MRIAAPLVALTLAIGVTLGGAAIATAGVHDKHAQLAGTVGAGRTASRSAVPWSKVGTGWTLVTYSTATPFAAQPQTGATTLYLVNPSGGKYVMYRWPHVPADGGVHLLGWSGDGKRAMLEVAKSPKSSAEQLDQLTLASGKLTRLRLPASASPISYTRPDGLAVLAYRLLASPLRIQLARYNLSGRLEKVLVTLKTTSNNGGFVNIGQSSPYNPDGTALALTAAPGGVTAAEHAVLVSNAGGLIRRYRSADSCLVAGWWTASQLLTGNCATKRLFVTPVSGAKPSPLTASTSPGRFVQDAWRLAGHVYVQLTGPACGTGSLGVVRNRRLATVPVPKLAAGATIATASASKLLIVAERCMGSSGLLWFNPRNSAEVRVLGQNQGQGVTGWVPYYEVNGQ
jgi:TolB protein